jgi:hypothetical protein
MRQVWITKRGGPEVLQVREAADPVPKDGRGGGATGSRAVHPRAPLHMVNLASIRELRPWSHGDWAIMLRGRQLMLSRRY